MITYIKIDGFKSFKDFEMHFTPFTVIAGTNASGKSNLFDALQLLSDLADPSESSLNGAFGKQRGNGTELFTQYDEDVFAKEMSFTVEMLVPPVVTDAWGGRENLKHTRLRYELSIGRGIDDEAPFQLRVKHEKLTAITKKEDRWVKELIPRKYQEGRIPKLKTGAGRSNPFIDTKTNKEGTFIRIAEDGGKGEGRNAPAEKISRTVLSGSDSVRFSHACAARQEISGWRFLFLNTDHLRQPTIKAAGFSDIITPSGRNLAAALYRIQKPEPFIMNDLSRDMANLISPIVEVMVKDDSANNQYLIEVKSSDGKKYSSRVLSEGTLRLLALSIFRHDYEHTGLLCYEEPENGIHPGRIPALVRLLNELAVDFSDPGEPLRQVLINTHSPILVGEVVKLAEDHGASVWFTQLASTAVSLEEKKYPLKITRITPVEQENSKRKVLARHHFAPTENMRKMTLMQARDYLSVNGDADTLLAL